MKRFFALFCVATLSTAPASAQVFTSQAAFEAALNPGFFSNSFQGLTGAPTTFTGGTPPISFSISAPQGLYYGPSLTGTNLPNDPFTFTITGGSPNAIGGNFFTTNISDAFVPGVEMTLTYSDGFVDTFTPTSATEFRGYATLTPLTGLTITSNNAATYVSTSTIRMGITPVPEPVTTGLLAVAGLGGLTALRRRFRKTA